MNAFSSEIARIVFERANLKCMLSMVFPHPVSALEKKMKLRNITGFDIFIFLSKKQKSLNLTCAMTRLKSRKNMTI